MEDQGAKKIWACRIEPGCNVEFSAPVVWVIYDGPDGAEHKLFDYFPEEISFTPDEFIGLTEDEAFDLKVKKDEAYMHAC